ncbi:uncharacterized protein BCR38DRAFT_422359 [Pseudomassariella vexata]|uniref:PPPDE domain-containing protein n=1 Tax=Pseudomassariella vexata TaxID=1141098 RepID=A0A1Y2EA52_9PEZI|nr:uncharacterized protein BCR38DRAFT_422359 [Pseudomassariella vexata]ORY68184.1 hypothetical protein BCR38DRAFT_422359 [Pseudomassariella vexata]
MGFEVLTKLAKKWDEVRARPGLPNEPELDAESIRLREERKQFLQQVSSKITGDSVREMPPLRFDTTIPTAAVFLVTTPIEFGKFELSKNTYRLLGRHVGMSLNSISHWALCVIERGLGECWCYDLMSDQMMLNAIGKNYFRTYEITPEFIATWSSCYYVGETMKSNEEIQELGMNHMALNPRYHLLKNNCQTLVEDLVKELCDGGHISQSMLSEELNKISPKMALDLMTARLRSKVDDGDEKDDSKTVEEDVAVIKGLWNRVRR